MSDIDTAAADSLKVLDPERPIREGGHRFCDRLDSATAGVARVRMANGWALGKFTGEFAPARRLTLGSSNLVYFLRAYFAYTASHVRLWPQTSFAARQQYVRNQRQSGGARRALKMSQMTQLRPGQFRIFAARTLHLISPVANPRCNGGEITYEHAAGIPLRCGSLFDDQSLLVVIET